MNDKINLHLQPHQFKVNNHYNNHFTVENYFKTTPNNELIEKQKSYYNSDICNIDINGYGMKISFNPNRIQGYKYKLDNLPYNEFNQSLDKLKEHLYKIGVEPDINNAKITRYDNSFDIAIQQPYNEFKPLINTLMTTTKPLRRGKNRMERNTLYLGNKSNEITIYDKTTQQSLDTDILRIEKRQLKIRPENKITLSLITPKIYDKIRSQDKQFIEANIFNKNPNLLANELEQFQINLLTSNLTYQEIRLECFLKIFTPTELINSLLRVNRKDKNYRRNLKIRNLLNSMITTNTPDIIEMYNYLKNEFKKAI